MFHILISNDIAEFNFFQFIIIKWQNYFSTVNLRDFQSVNTENATHLTFK